MIGYCHKYKVTSGCYQAKVEGNHGSLAREDMHLFRSSAPTTTMDVGEDTMQPSKHGRMRNIIMAGSLLAVFAVLGRTASTEHSAGHLGSGILPPDEIEMEKVLDSQKQKKKSEVPLMGSHSAEAICERDDYSKISLKAGVDLPLSILFKDTRGQKKFEASDVIKVGDQIYAICDNSWSISKFEASLTPFSSQNIMIGDADRVKGEDSGYEALIHHDGTFFAIRESVLLGDDTDKEYHAVIEELELGEDDYNVSAMCPTEFEFEGDSKGFEGAVSILSTDNELLILGLCEGNYCSEEKKGKRGHGRIVVMKKTYKDSGGTDESQGCIWETVRLLKIPKEVDFLDYSAIALTAEGRVAITSQEDSKVWLGQLKGLDDQGRFDVENTEFDLDKGKMLTFPKSSDCKTVYCNIEGIHFLNENMLIAVSDKMKSKGKQSYECLQKDQSVHIFVLP